MTDLGNHIPEPPKDGISVLRYAHGSTNNLLAGSWDGNVHIYDGASGARIAVLSHGAPVLDATFESDSIIYSCGLDKTVKRIDIATGNSALIGTHDAPVKCVEWLPSLSLVATAGWDSTLRIWDPRLPPNSPPISQFTLPGKAFSMSTSDTRLVVATAHRRVVIYDIKSLTNPSTVPEQDRESSLKFQTRCLRCFPNGEGFAISSVEGRVGMEYFDISEEVQARKYAFKCHRRSEGGKDVVYPVNAIAFNEKHGTFATGGCDGAVSFWDGQNKKRLHQVIGYPTSVAALAFNKDATMVAVAASYTYERGETEHPPEAIYLRAVVESEVLPRQKQKAAAS